MRLMVAHRARWLAVGALSAVAAAIVVRNVGLVGLAMPLVLLVLIAPLCNPRFALGLLVAAAILFESGSSNVLPFTTQQFHDPLPGHYGLLELLMALAVCSVLLDASRRRRVPLRPAPFGPVLGLLTLALLTGSVVGHYAGQGVNPITEQIRPILPLIIVPWLTVNTIRDRTDLPRAVGLLAILIVVKAVLGLIGVLAHVGVAAGGTTITYYEATPNWLTMTFLLTMLAAIGARLPLKRVARWAVPLMLAAIVLSLRRSFWIGTVAATPLAFVIATGPVGRRFFLPAAAILSIALWITVASGFVIDSKSPIGGRIQSLTPSKLAANTEDRYRLDERMNVLAEIRTSPLMGLGLAVPWQERYPLSIETTSGGRQYVHFAVLWFWLKLGAAGVIAYLGYLLTAIVVGIQVFRRHQNDCVRAAAAGAAAALAGLAVAETTATWLGTDLRMTVTVGCIVGLLAVARRQIGSAVVATPPQAPRSPGDHSGRGTFEIELPHQAFLQPRSATTRQGGRERTDGGDQEGARFGEPRVRGSSAPRDERERA